jgi:hypothetical protein
VAKALQHYGMIVVNTADSPAIMPENLLDNPLTTGSWDERDLGYGSDVIAQIPYQEFRVLALPEAYWDAGASASYFGICLMEP